MTKREGGRNRLYQQSLSRPVLVPLLPVVHVTGTKVWAGRLHMPDLVPWGPPGDEVGRSRQAPT